MKNIIALLEGITVATKYIIPILAGTVTVVLVVLLFYYLGA